LDQPSIGDQQHGDEALPKLLEEKLEADQHDADGLTAGGQGAVQGEFHDQGNNVNKEYY
jgi:hypothetical protein